MSDVTVKALDGEDWQAFRDVRLAALRESPEAFASSYEAELEYDEDFWRARLARSERPGGPGWPGPSGCWPATAISRSASPPWARPRRRAWPSCSACGSARPVAGPV